jgi:hypothetical protein
MSIVQELELEVGAHHYRIARMSAFDAMTVASEFRDILIGLSMVRTERPKEMTDKEYTQAVQFITMSRGNVTEEMRRRIVTICLSQVSRRSGQGYQKVLASPGTFQFDDIELPDIAKLLYASFEHNKLLDFFGESPSDSGPPKTTESLGQVSETEKTG